VPPVTSVSPCGFLAYGCFCVTTGSLHPALACVMLCRPLSKVSTYKDYIEARNQSVREVGVQSVYFNAKV
jgi:hypothetical protein